MRPLDPRLLQYAGAVRPYLAATTVLGVAATGLVVAQAGLLATAVTSAFLDGAGLDRLSGQLGWLAAVVVARAVVTGAQEALARRTSVKVQAQLRNRLLDKVFQLGPGWLSQQRSAEIAVLTTRGVRALDGYFAQYLPQLVLAGLVPVAVLACLLPADLVAFVTVLVTVPLVPVFLALVGLATQERTRRQWATLERLSHHFLDVVSGLATLKIYGRARRQAEVVAKVTDDYRRTTMATLRLAFLSSLVLELLATLSVALVAVGIGLRLLAGHLDLRTALFVLVLAPEAYLPLRKLGASYHAAAEGLAAADAIFAIIQTPLPERVDPAAGQEVGAGAGGARSESVAAVEIRDLVVQRPGRPGDVLDRLTLTVAPGELVALTGPSGAGKSTLFDAVLGFAPVRSGRIAVSVPGRGTTVLDDEPPARWREQFAWVPQRPYVVAGSVADNVRLGRPDAEPSQVRWALAAAGGLDEELPDGLATAVGEGGAGLSVGQVRRLALARALVQDKDILLLDEPTAGLDPATEARVVRTLRERRPGRAVLVVTHRPAVLAAADRVVTLGAVGAECVA